jgi:hypothetical protein
LSLERSPRSTTYTDADHLQVAIPAGDLASSQTVTLTAENPVSGKSNSITVAVQ